MASVIGKTYDNLDVLDEYGLCLKWSWPRLTRNEWFCIGAFLEFNTDQDGKRYPYLVIDFGMNKMQVGWLWG